MVFQLKVKVQKNKLYQQSFSKIEKFKSMLSKAKFVAKNVIYVKKWSEKEEKFKFRKLFSSSEISNYKNLDINISCFSIKTVKGTDPLIIRAKELRQKSFFKNSNPKEFDSDEFDELCDHLVVVDRSVSEDFVVGTYRLLLKPKFLRNQKFYSQSEFDISKLININQVTLLEAGRSCVHEKYRDGRIIKLLWRGLATYIIDNNVDLIFGCASFPSSNYQSFVKQLSYLHHYHKAPNSFYTQPIEKLKAGYNIIDKSALDIEEQFRSLPPLIKAYIRAGAWIGTGAIVDKKFNTTDVLIILISKKILKKYSQLSFQKNH